MSGAEDLKEHRWTLLETHAVQYFDGRRSCTVCMPPHVFDGMKDSSMIEMFMGVLCAPINQVTDVKHYHEFKRPTRMNDGLVYKGVRVMFKDLMDLEPVLLATLYPHVVPEPGDVYVEFLSFVGG